MKAPGAAQQPDILIRPMQQADLPEATRIFRLAFGTFVGMPDPNQFSAGRDLITSRWHYRAAALVAEVDGRFAGSNLATRWGSFAFVGPLTVRPDLWDRKIAQKLLAPTMDLFDQWGIATAGLFTFPHSPKHIGLYQKYGFWPRLLTPVMIAPVAGHKASALRFSASSDDEKSQILAACRELTDAIYDGLDVTSEIRAVQDQSMGDTVMIWPGDNLQAFAVCHHGPRSEAAAGACYIKFAAVRPGPNADTDFAQLLDACDSFAAENGLERIEAGVNTGRSNAYRHMLRRGFRTQFIGVAMHRPNSTAFSREDDYVLDDWR